MNIIAGEQVDGMNLIALQCGSVQVDQMSLIAEVSAEKGNRAGQNNKKISPSAAVAILRLSMLDGDAGMLRITAAT